MNKEAAPKLQGKTRTGKAAASRAAGAIPGVLYGHGIKNVSLEIEAKAFRTVFDEAGQTTLIDLTVDQQGHNVLIREVQLHPVRSHIMHVDFYQVNMKEKVTTDVPLIFTGESIAVKDHSGVLLRNFDTVEVEALPADLPRHITVDISQLKNFEDVIKISDLEVANGIALLGDGGDIIALVQPPRTEEELEKLEEEVSEDVEAVEGVADAEEGEGETEDDETGDDDESAKDTEASKEDESKKTE